MGGGGVPGPEVGDVQTHDLGNVGQSAGDTPGPEAASDSVEQNITLTGWPRDLRWRDFRQIENRPDGEAEDALVAPETITGEARIFRDGGQWMIAELSLDIIVRREMSWVIRSRRSVDLLKHEQGHFDIHGMIVGRDLVEEIKALRGRSGRRLANALRTRMRRARRRAQRLTDSYDSDTNHGLNEDRQNAWNERFQQAKTTNQPLTPPD